ncbi:hypothetical protein DY000_02064000 [Brassica cretica]|uniref:Uncharacterized protein n=1 Tax=Brassica cretica TaxID=69181 RepID=A0ABQ7B299_BRACR|nr:hypothetical protein DY000_02064000 [Brassica cretica]
MAKNPAKSQQNLQLNRAPVPWIRKRGLLGSDEKNSVIMDLFLLLAPLTTVHLYETVP